MPFQGSKRNIQRKQVSMYAIKNTRPKAKSDYRNIIAIKKMAYLTLKCIYEHSLSNVSLHYRRNNQTKYS